MPNKSLRDIAIIANSYHCNTHTQRIALKSDETLVISNRSLAVLPQLANDYKTINVLPSRILVQVQNNITIYSEPEMRIPCLNRQCTAIT